MKIVRAMKKVARLKGEIRELKKRMDSCLNTLDENEFDEGYRTLEQELHSKVASMVELKTRIMHTNVVNNMFSVIVNLGEFKSYMEYLKELHPKVGKQSTNRFSDDSEKFKSQLSIQEKNEMIAACQQNINELTDELDEFNAKTDLIDVEIKGTTFG